MTLPYMANRMYTFIAYKLQYVQAHTLSWSSGYKENQSDQFVYMVGGGTEL